MRKRRLPSFKTKFSCYSCPDSVIAGDGKERRIFCKRLGKEVRLVQGIHYPADCPTMKSEVVERD